jgi:hypothetical protein
MDRVVGFAVVLAVALATAPLWTRSDGLAPASEAVATSVRVLPLEIISAQVRNLLLK